MRPFRDRISDGFVRTKRLQLLRCHCEAAAPVIAESTDGVPALRETARAIVDTAKWRP